MSEGDSDDSDGEIDGSGDRHATPGPPSQSTGRKKKGRGKRRKKAQLAKPPADEAPAEPEREPRATAPHPRASLSGRRSRTTLMDVGDIAQRLSLIEIRKSAHPNTGRQLGFSFGIAVALVLLVTMMFLGGAWRLVIGVLAGTTVATLAIWGTLRALPKLAKRLGPRELPGPAMAWVVGLVVIAAASGITFTWSFSEATKPLGVQEPEGPPEPPPSALAPAPKVVARADAKVKRGTHVRVSGGVFYVPPKFESADGQFDLLIHYHGNAQLVKDSVNAVGLNALVRIVNRGDGSGKYSEPLRNPRAFDNSLGALEKVAQKQLGLENPRIRRIALSSWSAGFGAVYQVLSSRTRLDRVDTLLMMDSLHGSFAAGSKRVVTGLSLKPYTAFARRAVAGEKLFILTHSEVETVDYPSTGESAGALLKKLEISRETVDAGTVPLVVPTLKEAVNAFPSGERNWLQATSRTEQGKLLVLGCEGDGKGDHIAHLAQMSTVLLPRLVARWKAPGDGGAPE